MVKEEASWGVEAEAEAAEGAAKVETAGWGHDQLQQKGEDGVSPTRADQRNHIATSSTWWLTRSSHSKGAGVVSCCGSIG